MKTKLVLAAALGLLIVSCMGNKKRKHRSDFLPPIKIEMPASVKNDPELADVVKKSEDAINEFSDNMEYLIEDLKPYQNIKDKEDVGTFDKIKMTKIMAEFMLNSTKGMEVLDELNDYTEKRMKEEKPLNDEQMKAMAVIHDTFEARMKQLEKKYQDFGGEKQ